MSVKPSTCYSWVTCQYLYTMHNDNSFIWQPIWTLLGGIHWVGIHEVRIHRVGIWKGGNSPGGNSPGGNGPGGNSPGGIHLGGFSVHRYLLSEVYFSPHQRNIVCEHFDLNKNSKENQSWNENKHFHLFLIFMLRNPVFLNVKTTISRFYTEST